MSFLCVVIFILGTFLMKIFIKNDFSQIDPESIWDGSWISRASKNINLNAWEASRITKNMKNLKKVINSKIGQENEEIDSTIMISIFFGFLWIQFTFL